MAQLNIRVFWAYYRATTAINLVFSIIMAFFSQKAFWFPIVFASFGIGVGILFFNYYYKKQYYFYHNLGYTRKRLALNTFLVNLPIAAIIFIVIQLF